MEHTGKKLKAEVDFTTRPLLKKTILFALPLVLSSVLQLLYSAAYVIVLGRFAGDESEAAVAAVGDASATERDLAGLGYFLTDQNKAVAEYNLRVSFNNNLDEYEKEIIKEEEDIEYESGVRTTPTGVNTANSDFVDPAYRIYTGTGIADNASPKGSYEPVDGSTTS